MILRLTKKLIKIPKRNPDSHKGNNGQVLAVGGSEDLVGALTLASLAAARSGADLVIIFAPEKVAWAINKYSPDLITKKAKGKILTLKHYKIIKELIKKNDTLLIGNGIGINTKTKKLCKKIISSTNKLKVIDADAIKAISIKDCENSIITPHSKEFEIFLKNSKIKSDLIKKIINQKNIELKTKLIKKTLKQFFDNNNILLLKGKTDIIISKNKIAINKTGNAGLTRGGTGDILAGLCAGFLSQNKDLFQSAANAAYFNGLIGDILLKKKKGISYLASDMVGEIKRLKFS
tara:strand:- start:17898 stop:18770 length:873 start_codon:yes stop_codon:yes gene_type:complete